jgi:hypothetical protein
MQSWHVSLSVIPYQRAEWKMTQNLVDSRKSSLGIKISIRLAMLVLRRKAKLLPEFVEFVVVVWDSLPPQSSSKCLYDRILGLRAEEGDKWDCVAKRRQRAVSWASDTMW